MTQLNVGAAPQQINTNSEQNWPVILVNQSGVESINLCINQNMQPTQEVFVLPPLSAYVADPGQSIWATTVSGLGANLWVAAKQFPAYFSAETVISTGSVEISGTVDVALVGTNTVDIGNTPSVTVSGTPTVQVTSGNIAISNTPGVTVTSGTISIGNTPAVTVNSGSIAISNTPDVTVTSGTISISGTPNVNISNTPSVSISGTPNVNISSTSGNIPISGTVTVGSITSGTITFTNANIAVINEVGTQLLNYTNAVLVYNGTLAGLNGTTQPSVPMVPGLRALLIFTDGSTSALSSITIDGANTGVVYEIITAGNLNKSQQTPLYVDFDSTTDSQLAFGATGPGNIIIYAIGESIASSSEYPIGSGNVGGSSQLGNVGIVGSIDSTGLRQPFAIDTNANMGVNVKNTPNVAVTNNPIAAATSGAELTQQLTNANPGSATFGPTNTGVTIRTLILSVAMASASVATNATLQVKVSDTASGTILASLTKTIATNISSVDESVSISWPGGFTSTAAGAGNKQFTMTWSYLYSTPSTIKATAEVSITF